LKIITFRTFQNPSEAHIVKGRLENEGIRCFLTNENTTTLLPHMTFMFGAGVQLMLHESDFDKASEILNENKAKEIVCPNCSSNNIKFGLGKHKLKKIFFIFISLFAFTPFNNMNNTYYCKDCKTEFKV
jgi:hypothetical protein